MAYIDKSRAIGMLERFREEHSNLPNACLKMIDVALNIIKQIPTADVVEVVRCSECKYKDDCARQMVHTTQDYVLEQNISTYNKVDFCSYGERRTDDD